MGSGIYAGSTGTINFRVSTEIIGIVAHLVVKRTNEVVGRFAYPAKDGYQLLVKTGNDYTGRLTAEMTENISTEQLKIEVKPYVDELTSPIGAADVRMVIDNTLKSTTISV